MKPGDENEWLEAHICCDERGLLSLGWPVKNLLGWRVGSEGQGGKCIHDEVDPEELHSGEDRLHVLVVHGSDKS